MNGLPPLFLKRREERRVRAGHPWIFSNEVDVARSPLDGFAAGDAVEVLDHGGRVIGSAYVNPHTLICARMVSRRAGVRLDGTVLRERLARALGLRERCYTERCYRLVFGESDWLPGLVVDRYDDVLVAQFGTAGMERVRAAVLDGLIDWCAPRAVVLRNDGANRELEGLERGVEVCHGRLSSAVPLWENGTRFEADVLAGQKTGWYFDHRDNRARLAGLCRGARVLDCFSYSGAWGIQALAAGAASALCVDSSGAALDRARGNAALNGVADRLAVREANVFDALRAIDEAGERFDVVIVDPPAFVRRRKDLKAGIKAYQRLNRLAMRVLGADGLLLSASCSAHLSSARLLDALRGAAQGAGARLQLIARGHQGADHPVHPAMPESDYLKAFLLRVVH